LRFFGEISYGLYLIHILVFDGYDALARSYWPGLAAHGGLAAIWLRFICAGGAAVALAYLSRRYIEERFPPGCRAGSLAAAILTMSEMRAEPSNLMRLRCSYRNLKRAIRALRGKDLWQGPQIEREKLRLGNEGACWCVCPLGLSTTSVVYSFGVGEDISFDLALLHRFGLQVHAFDPTPRSIQWLQSQTMPQEFVFHPYGVAGFDGTCVFLPPENSAHVSHTIVPRKSPRPAIEVPMHRLGTIMNLLGHEQIDLLKMDIEGAEYGVIADLLACHIPVKQLLVEFHHRWPEVGIEKTRQAIRSLNQAGFRIFYVSPSGEEYSFLSVQPRKVQGAS
jgi:FkbM family methyltransferase